MRTDLICCMYALTTGSAKAKILQQALKIIQMNDIIILNCSEQYMHTRRVREELSKLCCSFSKSAHVGWAYQHTQ